MPRRRLIGGPVAIAAVAWAVAATAQPFAYVANLGSDDVSVIDTLGLLPVATLPGGDDPNGVAVSPDGRRVYVSSFLSGTVHTVDALTQEVLATAAVGPGPVGLAVTPDGERVYVTRRGDNRVAVLGLASGTVEAVIPVGRGPNAIAITPDGTTALVTNSARAATGEVSVLDLATDTVRSTITVARRPNRVAITPDGRTAYVTNFRSWTSTAIDLASESVRTTFRAGHQSTGVAVNPNGYWGYITDARRDQLLIIDVSADQVTRAIDLGPFPTAIGLQRHGGTGYVTDFAENSLRVVDLGDEAVVADLSVGERPFAVAVNCFDAGCSETPYTPKPTRTATETPTESPTPTPTATLTATATTTPTRTLPSGISHALFDLAAEPVAAGEITHLTLTLQPGGQAVYGLREQITLPTGISLRLEEEGFCAIGSQVAVANAEFHLTHDACGFDCHTLTVSIDFVEPLSEPASIYTCELHTSDFLPVGTIRLRHLDNTAFDADGGALPSRGRDAVLVLAPPATPSPDLTPRPTRTPTRPPLATVFIVGGRAEARPGERVTLPVTLTTGDQEVAGTQNDIGFVPGIAVAARPNGRPDCTVNPAIDKNATSFAFQPPGCAASGSGNCDGMRAIVVSFESVDPIPDGAVLYTCAVDVATDVAAGSHTLRLTLQGASTPDGTDVPVGAFNAAVTVIAPAAARQRAAAASAARVCTGGGRDGLACARDGDCPSGACVVPQGICDGGEDDGLLCDCPGGTCRAAGATCGGGPDAGSCQGGELDGACCDRSFGCGGGTACVATARLCAGGPAKGSPCLADANCFASTCVASPRRCAGGQFDGVACIDASDCPTGTCFDPAARPTAAATPTAPPAVETDDSCAIVRPSGGSAWWLLIPAILLGLHRGSGRERGRLARNASATRGLHRLKRSHHPIPAHPE